jgi:hypothetical protein
MIRIIEFHHPMAKNNFFNSPNGGRPISLSHPRMTLLEKALKCDYLKNCICSFRKGMATMHWDVRNIEETRPNKQYEV